MIPPHITASLDRYRDKHVPTGGFLRAVLENNLYLAVSRADMESIRCLTDVVRYVVSTLPPDAWGSEEKVDDWLKTKENQ